MVKGLLSALARYGMAVATVAIALAIGWYTPLNQLNPTSLFFASVMISSWYGGLGPGLVATLLSVLAIDYLLIEPVFALFLDLGDLTRMSVFVLEAVLISGLNGRRRRLETSLQAQNDRLLAAHQFKDEFLATLGHELRNPLSPISNSLHLVRMRYGDDATVERVCEIAERQVRHMTRLIDDLLDVSRISRGKVQLQKETVELATVVADAVAGCRVLMESRGHRLTTSLPAEPIWLEADATRLTQVLANLLSNAAKYTEPGGRIGLTARCEDGLIVLRVRDNGLGISEELMPHVFEPFVQAERLMEHSEGGLGIGLSLVKGLVTLHGGEVEAHSAGPRRGSEFVVRLPMLPVSPPHDDAADRGDQRSGGALRILVVDDNADAAQLLSMMLEMWGHEVRVACDGPSALELIDEFTPEAVLLDLELPRMSGYEVARRIRHLQHMQQPLLVALTGHAQEDDFRRTREEGFDHHLLKPLEIGVLERLLADFAASRPRPLSRPLPR